MKLKYLITEFLEFSIQDNDISYNKSTNTFSTDLSQLGKNFFPTRNGRIYLKNNKSGDKVLFNFWKIDYEGTMNDREVAGYWYKSNDSKYKFLIVND